LCSNSPEIEEKSPCFLSLGAFCTLLPLALGLFALLAERRLGLF
jgi:hypothetical protein